jgi:toxin YoeB
VRLFFADDAWEEYPYWQRTDQIILKRINALIKEIQRTPYQGVSKPEALKHEFSGYWSRRITDEHRIVYKVEEDSILSRPTSLSLLNF